MELRVLSGPRAGCRLPLGVGTYRAGADETCDVVLEDFSGSETAFVIYVGQRSLGLESLTDELRLGGRAVSGLVPLAAGQVFELGPWLFAVDEAEAPWPSDPESLRASAQRGNAAGSESRDGDGDEAALASMDAGARDADATGHGDLQGDNERGNTEGDRQDDAQADSPGGRQNARGDRQGSQQLDGQGDLQNASASNADASASAARRRKVPFWVIGLAGAAAFLVCGVMVLVMSLAPAQPAAAAGSHESAGDRLAKLVNTSGGDVKLEHIPGGRSKLAGSVSTRAEKMKLTRDARAIDPMVLLQVNDDEDLATLARDALTQFPQSGVELGKVDHGRLFLTGRVSEAKLRDQIVTVMWDSVPGLTAVDSRVLAGDEVIASANALLRDAALTKRITAELDHNDPARLTVHGVLPETERQAWLGVREKLETQFGAALVIAEDLHAPDAIPPSMPPMAFDVVAIVRGPMPYMLLRDGTKRAIPAGASER